MTKEQFEQFRIVLTNPVNATLVGSGSNNMTIQNDDAEPLISVADVSVVEGNAGQQILNFIVSLSVPSSDNVRVNYTTVDGTAISSGNPDYSPVSGTLSFGAKVTSLTISVLVFGDLADESDETFTLHLSQPHHGTLSRNDAIGTIVNDDHIIVNVLRSNGGETLFGYETTKLSWSASDGGGASLAIDLYMSADGGFNYAQIASGVPNTGSYLWTVDYRLASPCTAPFGVFKVVARNEAGASGTDVSDAPFTIIYYPPVHPRDPHVSSSGVISIYDASLVEGNSGQAAVSLKVAKSGLDAATVGYVTMDGTATAGNDDYAPASGTLSFGCGNSQTITVLVRGDLAREPDETFTVHLQNATNATISDGDAVVTIVNDDQVQVTVLSPNGGDTLIVGEQRKLSWSADEQGGGPLSIDLYVSRNYSLPSASAVFSVVATDTSGNSGADVSDAPFSIYDLATPTLLSLFHASSTPDGIELRWRFGDPTLVSAVTVERATAADGPWSVVGTELENDRGETVALDRSAAMGTTYLYRLEAKLRSGRTEVYGPVTVSAGEAIASFALTRIGADAERRSAGTDRVHGGEGSLRTLDRRGPRGPSGGDIERGDPAAGPLPGGMEHEGRCPGWNLLRALPGGGPGHEPPSGGDAIAGRPRGRGWRRGRTFPLPHDQRPGVETRCRRSS